MALERKLKIPSNAIQGFVQLLQMDDADFTELQNAFAGTAPSLYRSDFANSIAERVSFEPEKVTDVVYTLLGLYITRSYDDTEIATFVQYICDALVRENNEKLKPINDDWDHFKQRLSRLLEFSNSLGLTAKALDVMTEHEHVYLEKHGRILSDIRPIFGNDASAVPTAAVVVHTMKIGYQKNGEYKEFFVALDSNDLRDLHELIVRAEQKEKSLRDMLSAVNIQYLEAKEVK